MGPTRATSRPTQHRLDVLRSSLMLGGGFCVIGYWQTLRHQLRRLRRRQDLGLDRVPAAVRVPPALLTPTAGAPALGDGGPDDADPASRPSSADHWFEALADHLGAAYLRYSFTKGTEQEVGFLVDALGLEPGEPGARRRLRPGPPRPRPGRAGHRGASASTSPQRFVDARPRGRARRASPSSGSTPARCAFDGEFDAVISLCQGAFGLAGGPGAATATAGRPRRRRARRHGPRAAARAAAWPSRAFSRLLPGAVPRGHRRASTPRAGVNHERTELRDARRARRPRTTCGPRASRPGSCGCWPAAPGSRSSDLWSVTPGAYAARRARPRPPGVPAGRPRGR